VRHHPAQSMPTLDRGFEERSPLWHHSKDMSAHGTYALQDHRIIFSP
jgi:hypothetical protein